jgi:CBS domain-containing protein
MKIQDLPEFRNKDSLLAMAPDTPLITAVKAMAEKNYGSVLVTDADDRLHGIFTERDLQNRVIAMDLNPAHLSLEDVMTSDLYTARVDDEVAECLRQMSNERFRHMPVVDENDRVIGMMSQGDFVAVTWPQLISRLGDAMQATMASKYQLFWITGAILIYTILLISFIGGELP